MPRPNKSLITSAIRILRKANWSFSDISEILVYGVTALNCIDAVRSEEEKQLRKEVKPIEG